MEARNKLKLRLPKRALLALLALALPASLACKISLAGFAQDLPAQPPTPYTAEIGQKVSARCSYIRDYLSKGFRINELASRQNRVRGWEYILQSLDSLKKDYQRLGKDPAELEASLQSLKSQLDQFRKDFEAYDAKLQELIAVDCQKNPEEFWAKLNESRSYRAGIAIALENFNSALQDTIQKEEQKW